MWQSSGLSAEFWYYASIVTIAGQLHYVASFNAYAWKPLNGSSLTLSPVCYVFDYNISEGAWHFWDLGQYQQIAASGAGFQVFTTPILDVTERFAYSFGPPGPENVIATNRYLLFGGITSLFPNPGTIAGQLFQFVPFDYDVTTNPYIPYWSSVYTALSVPVTTFKFRGEVVSLGHQISFRRVRFQGQMAPFPGTFANQQQQVVVTLEGSSTKPVSTSPINVQANVKMTTYYGDAYLKDDMIQATVATAVGAAASPWATMTALRLSSVSVIVADEQGSTQ